MNNISTRNLQDADYPEMMRIDQLVFNSSTSPAPMKQRTIEEYAERYTVDKVFVAEIEGKVAGYIGYDNPTGLKSNSHVMEFYIAVHPDFQGKGIGRALINHLTNWGREQGFLKLSLRVLSINEAAIAFYISNGFKEQGRLMKEFLLDGVFVDDIMMYKML